MSAASAAQLAANQANAQLSTGPTTQDGKRRSSLNATRHGLTGRVVVLSSEDLSVYQTFSQELLASLDPKTPLERELAQTVVDQQWRLNRIRTIEDGMLALGDPAVDSAMAAAQAFLENSKAFVNLTIYEQRIHRIMEKALAQLKQLQAERKALEHSQIEEALHLQKLHKEEGLLYDPQTDGFVFSSDQLEHEAARRDRNQRLQQTHMDRIYANSTRRREQNGRQA